MGAPSRGLSPLFSPRSIVVVGASRDPAKLGHVLLKNVIDAGFQGEVCPVNPAGGEILGLSVRTTLLDVPRSPDLVLLSIPNRAVPQALRDAASVGARAAIVLSSGFGEMGGEGATLQAGLRTRGMRVLGPNCMGVCHLPARLNATYFWDVPMREGNLAFVSQSGAYGGLLLREVRRRGMGLSTFASIGNQADISHADVMEHLAREGRVEVVALFVEQVKDGARFLQACRLLARTKRVVAFKVGKGVAGRRAAQSHTGSLAGDYEVCRAALQQAGTFVARDTAEFFDTVAAFSHYPRGIREGKGLAIVTISGGPCVAAADACGELEVPVPELTARTQARVRALTPEFSAPRNPVDMTPQMEPARMQECVEAVSRDPRVGALLAINVGLDRPEFAEAFVRARRQLPVFAFVADAPTISARFEEEAIPNFDTPERAVKAFAALAPRRQTCGPSSSPSSPHEVAQTMSSRAVAGLLMRMRIPACRQEEASSAQTAIRAAARIGFPIVLKSTEAGSHKSDRGGVVVGLRSNEELTSAYAGLAHRLGPRVLVQEMIAGDHEVLIGARRDPVFGSVVVFGSGGVYAEQARDVSLRVCPIDLRTARDMIAETSAGERLRGLRGRRRGDIDLLARVLVSLSRWMPRLHRISEVDLNPVITGGPVTAAVDARFVLSPRASRRGPSAPR